MKTINNNIEETYCSFEVSKLLKEKGFNKIGACYTEDKQFYISSNLLSSRITGKEEPSYINTSTHALVIEWIRVNFMIWIHVDSHEVGKWCYHTHKISAGKISPRITANGEYGLTDFNSPQEATEAALLYTLNNLIQ